jgi:hypothetical protein
MRCYDTKEPLLHYFSTPQHYIAVVVYHDSTLTSYSRSSPFSLPPSVSYCKATWVVRALASTSVKLQGLERVKGRRSGERCKRLAYLVGVIMEGVGGSRAMEEGEDR